MSIARYEQSGAEVAQVAPQVSAVAALTEWAHGAQAAHEVAVNLVETSFCPAHYRGKPHEATAAILSGLEVGLQPMAALQAFNPIQGSAAPKAITLRAIVQSRGHHVEIVESSASRAVAVGRRKGSTVEQRSVWTIERAEQMKLLGNANWQKQPTAMLIARATSEICRLVAADAILGIPYSYEELQDSEGPVQGQAVQVEPAASVGKPRRNAVSVLPAAEEKVGHFGEPVPAVDRIPVDAEGRTAAERAVVGRLDPNGVELRRLRELTAERVSTDLPEVMEWISAAVDRPVGGPKELSLAEARDLIGRLEGLPVKAETSEESA